jgi:PncC family amidohydrolase
VVVPAAEPAAQDEPLTDASPGSPDIGASADATAGPRDDDVTLDELTELALRVHERCLAAGATLATAESCTGGLVGHLLTEIPGASDTYLGGVISYSDELKRSGLGVPSGTLERHGAVSAQVAVAMAAGALERVGATVAVSVTGIAGPTGATESKPIGLTYVAVADAAGHDVRRHVWRGDRSANKRASAAAVLRLVLERIEGMSG